MEDQLVQMRALAARLAPGGGLAWPMPGLAVSVRGETTLPAHTLYEPMVCLILQGAKQVIIGDAVIRYDSASYFVASVELPATGCVVEASAARPYMALSLLLKPELLATLLADTPAPAEAGASPGFAVSPVTPQLLDPWLRLLRLQETPQDIAVLAPMLEREILYRLLQGPQGAALRQIARADSRLARVRRAIGWIRDNYDQPLRVEPLARLAGMSPASFHRHFKAATAMSPLQYQKLLRLQQARRLLIVDPDATRAAFAVGYESPSQFSREYARQFGLPPGRDAVRLRNDIAAQTDAASAA